MEQMRALSSVVEQKKLKLISVIGTTGAGKSKLAVDLAKKFDGEIISADSMQVSNFPF